MKIKKQIEVIVCDFCNKEVTTQNVYGKDICRKCFEKYLSTSKVVSQSLYSESLTKEIEEIIKEYDLNCSVEEFQDKVDWYWLSKHQKLSEELIEKFHDKVWWVLISVYRKLSREFRKKWKHKLN